jgi:hypothetical protein
VGVNCQRVRFFTTVSHINYTRGKKPLYAGLYADYTRTLTNHGFGMFCVVFISILHVFQCVLHLLSTPQRFSTIGPRELPVLMAPMGPPRPEPPDPDLGAPLARSSQIRPNNYTRTIRGVGLENMTLITEWS